MKRDGAISRISNKGHRRLSLAAGSGFHFYHDGLADVLAVFLPLWQSVFHLSLTQVGLLVTCYEGATGCFQIPAGIMGERFGERLLLVLGTLISAFCFMFIGFSSGLSSLILLLVLGGLGAAVQHPLASSLVSTAYADNGRRAALGGYNFSGDIGKFTFPLLAALLLSRIDWRSVCVGFGLFGIFLTAVLFLVLRVTAGGKDCSPNQQAAPFQSGKGWGISNRGAFSVLSIISIVDTGVRVGLVTFSPFLLIQKGADPSSVGFSLSLVFIGGAVGRIACGLLAERIGPIRTIVYTETATAVIIMLLTLLPLRGIYIILPIFGVVLSGTSTVLYGMVADFVHPQQITRAFGLFYTFVIAAAATGPPLIGRVGEIMGVSECIMLTGGIVLTTLPLSLILSKRMRHMDREKTETPHPSF